MVVFGGGIKFEKSSDALVFIVFLILSVTLVAAVLFCFIRIYVIHCYDECLTSLFIVKKKFLVEFARAGSTLTRPSCGVKTRMIYIREGTVTRLTDT